MSARLRILGFLRVIRGYRIPAKSRPLRVEESRLPIELAFTRVFAILAPLRDNGRVRWRLRFSRRKTCYLLPEWGKP